MDDSSDTQGNRSHTGRFVLLRHDLPPDSTRASHWDLMIEIGEILRTWELTSLSHLDQASPSETIDNNEIDLRPITRPLPEHRLAYLDYEGPVSNNRGVVQRIAMGVHESFEDPSSNVWKVQLTGAFADGRYLAISVVLPIT
ncbi:MAG: hypothetical protein U1A77_20220 [Pirellulales bacterium]